jgi:MoxR-like ATPase
MAEGQVSIEGVTYPLPTPFHVMATSNPVEFEGTYPLPEAQLDRFMVRLSVGYLDAPDETQVLKRRLERQREWATVPQITTAEQVYQMQRGTEAVHVDEDVVRYCVDLAHATRHHASLDVGVSPRGTQALLLLARAYAVIGGRDYVLPEDVKAVAIAALAHRITLTPTAWASGIDPRRLIEELLSVVPAPQSVAR